MRYATYFVTDHIACDQALHWGEKEKIIEIGETKKSPLGSLCSPISFPITSFFWPFSPLRSLFPGYRSRSEDTKLTKPGGGGYFLMSKRGL